jgi:hypothetical protein
MVFTDDWSGYSGIERCYRQHRVNHSQRIYVDGNVHTNTIEGFFGHFKTDVPGTHHSISTRWLPGYFERVGLEVEPSEGRCRDVPHASR